MESTIVYGNLINKNTVDLKRVIKFNGNTKSFQGSQKEACSINSYTTGMNLNEVIDFAKCKKDNQCIRLYFDVDCHVSKEIPYTIMDIVDTLTEFYNSTCHNNNGLTINEEEPIFSVSGYITNKEAYNELLFNKDPRRDHTKFKFPYCIWLATDKSLFPADQTKQKLMSFHVILINRIIPIDQFMKITSVLNDGEYHKKELQISCDNVNKWIDVDGSVYKLLEEDDETKYQVFRCQLFNKQPIMDQNSLVKCGILPDRLNEINELEDFQLMLFNFTIGYVEHKDIVDRNLDKYIAESNSNNQKSTVHYRLPSSNKSNKSKSKSVKSTKEVKSSKSKSTKSSKQVKSERSSEANVDVDKEIIEAIIDNKDVNNQVLIDDVEETTELSREANSSEEEEPEFKPCTLNDKKLLEKLVKMTVEKFENEVSIFELCGCDINNSKYEAIEKFLYTFKKNDLCINMSDLKNEVKLWFDRREHNTKFDNWWKKIRSNFKTDYNSYNINRFKSVILEAARNYIYGKDREISNIFSHLKFLSNSFAKHQCFTKSEIKTLRTIQKKLKIEYVEDNLELSDFRSEIKECYVALNEINNKNNITCKNRLYEMFDYKFNNILKKYLQHRYYENSSSSKYESVCWFKDLETYFYNNAPRSETYIKREFKSLDTNFVPEFDNQKELEYNSLIYNCRKELHNNPDCKIDIKNWLKHFRATFVDDMSYKIYLSWFHYKMNGKRLQLNLVNGGAKNCLKSAFVKNLQKFDSISVDVSIEQFMDKYNADILQYNVINLDEIQSLDGIDMSKVRETIKRVTTSNKIATQNKNVKMFNIDVIFDVIINTNSEQTITSLLGNEADIMLKRMRVLKRIELTEEQLNDPDFIDLEKNVLYQYQLYDYIKNKFNEEDGLLPIEKLMNITGKNNLDYENELINAQKGNASLNGIDEQLYNNMFDIFVKDKDKSHANQLKLNVTNFRQFCKNHWSDMFVQIKAKKANEIIAYIKSESKMNLSAQGRCKMEDIDTFVKFYTEHESYEDLKKSVSTGDVDNILINDDIDI